MWSEVTKHTSCMTRNNKSFWKMSRCVPSKESPYLGLAVNILCDGGRDLSLDVVQDLV